MVDTLKQKEKIMFEIEDDLIIQDTNGSEFTYKEFMNQGIDKAEKAKSTLSLKEEIKNSIHNILKQRGFDIDSCYDLSYDMSEILKDYIKVIEGVK